MKKLFTLMLGAAMTVFLFTGCGNKNNDMDMGGSSQPVETNAIKQRSVDAGNIENNVYTSKLLGLKYTATEEMTLANIESLDKMNQEYKDRLQGTTLDMFCSMSGDNKSNIRVELMQLENPNTTYDKIMNKVTKDNDTDEKKCSVKDCKLCDTDFTEISYTEFPNSKRLVKKVDKYIVMINVVATDAESVNKLLSGFSKADVN